MKLAKALMVRADMQKKLASLRERIGQNAVVQQGDKPHEDPTKLIKEAISLLQELEDLVVKINKANLENELPDGRTLTDAIAHRETLSAQHSLLQHAVAEAQKEPERYSMKEIKWVAVLKVGSLQNQIEDLAKKIRELNAIIQETNWKVEIGD